MYKYCATTFAIHLDLHALAGIHRCYAMKANVLVPLRFRLVGERSIYGSKAFAGTR
jgi:hypothetical protein